MTDRSRDALARLALAIERAFGQRSRPKRPTRRGPDAADNGVAVDPPRHPTLSRSIEAPLDA